MFSVHVDQFLRLYQLVRYERASLRTGDSLGSSQCYGHCPGN